MNPSTRHTAELALIYSVPTITNAAEKSRLCNLLKRLQKYAQKDLNKKPFLTNMELSKIIEKIQSWGNETGWLNDKKHVGTLLSFCADMIENSKFKFHPRILETINDIIAHLEAGGDFKYQSCWAGSLAAERWEKMFDTHATK